MNHSVPDRKKTSKRHEIDYNLELLDSFCAKPWDGQLELGFEKNPLREHILKQLGVSPSAASIILHVTTSNPSKQWPLSKFGAVIHELLRNTSLEIFLVGSEPKESLKRQLGLEDSERLHNVSGQTDLSQLALLLREARCVVSLDSGPYHLAWMQKVPVVGLFLEEANGSDPDRWGVYPGFTQARQIHKRADQISEREVIDGIYGCLQN